MIKILIIAAFFSCYSILSFSQGMQIQWQQCFGGTSSEGVFDMISTPGGYLIAGVTTSNDGTISFNHGDSDAWIVKINKSGEFLWEKTFGGSDGDTFRRIFKSDDNSYYAIGSSSSDDGDISNDPYPDNSDLWIVKIDSSGNILWDKIAGGNGVDIVYSGKVTDDGGIVVLVKTTSNNGDISNYFGLYDIWLVKFSSDGDIEWDFTLGSYSTEEAGDILLTDDGGYLVTGNTLITDGGNINCEAGGWIDAIAVKLDSSRNIEWQQCYGGSDGEIINSSLQTSDGYLFGGYTNSIEGPITGYHGGGDIWMIKTDFYGNIIWEKCFGGYNHEYVFNLFELSNGYAIVGGTASNNGDVSGNHGNNEYDHDVWILKIDYDGEIISQQCFGGIRNEDPDWGVVMKNDHDFVIATNSDRGPSYDVQCDITVYTGPDWWVFEAKDTTVGVTPHYADAIKLQVYPNPADDYVRFDYSYNFSVEEPILEFCNLQGMIIHQIPLDKKGGTEIWDCSSFSAGMYFYRVISGGQIVGKGKVVVDR